MNSDVGQANSMPSSHKNELFDRNNEANNKDTEEIFKVLNKDKDRDKK